MTALPEPVEGLVPGAGPVSVEEPDLHHHGDRDVGAGLVDLAVNVRVTTPPDWLAAVIIDSVSRLAAYPDPRPAAEAIAAAHGLAFDQVLPTAGGAETFTLLARAIEARHSVVVHPQFTEPEAALLATGRAPERHLLAPDAGFVLEAERVRPDADLVMIGNPTNPTSVLHRADEIRRLVRPGRVVVVDEAFMDAVPNEPETMVGGVMTGLVVLRSLTKTWGLAGLRAGYAVGDREVIAAMRRQQPPWSVSTPAIAATAACLSPDARQQVDLMAVEVIGQRDHLVNRLAELGLPVVPEPRAPFVLLDSSALRPDRPGGWLRLAIREQGFAVRRGETFPGLTADWIRIAVRDRDVTDRLIAAIRAVIAG